MTGYHGLSEQELAILCYMIKTKVFGGVTTDPGTVKKHLPKRLQKGVKNSLDNLCKKRFLKRTPKPDDRVYSISPSKLNKIIIADIQKNLDKIWDNIVNPPKEEKPKLEIYPSLLSIIQSACKDSRYTEIESIDTSTELDLKEGDREYYKAKVTLKITCPNTKKIFTKSVKIGVTNLYEKYDFYCKYCGRKHVLRGIKLIF